MARNQRALSAKQLQILEKARVLFIERGYDKTSMQDIARACNFEASNLYNHFKSKEQILFDMIQEMGKHTLPALAQIEADATLSPLEQLRQFIRTHLREQLSVMGSAGLLFEFEMRSLTPAHRRQSIQRRDRVVSLLCSIIERGQVAGDIRATDAKLTAILILSIVMRSRMWYRPGGALSIDEVADFIIDFVLNGIRDNADHSHEAVLRELVGVPSEN